MKTINLPAYGMVVTLAGSGGTIKSNLKDGDPADYGDAEYLAGVDAIESLVLAHAVAGIDVTSPAYLEGLETAVEALTNHTT